MRKMAFALYYSGFVGLMAAYTVKEVWLDRASLILLVLGCWVHARFWKHHIESVTAPVPSLVAALDLLNKQRSQMDFFIQLLPNLFLGKTFAEKNEYRFIRLADKSLKQAVRSHFNNPWESIPLALLGVVPACIFGIGEFHYERYYRSSPMLHDFMTHWMVAVMTFFLSLNLTSFFLCYLLKEK